MKRKVEIGKCSKLISNAIKEHASELLTGAAVVGVIFTAIAAYKAYPKVQKAKEDLPEDAKPVDIAVKVAPAVVTPVIVGTTTIACAVGSNIVSTKKILAVTAAYKALDEAYKAYKDKDKEIAGESHVEYIEEQTRLEREDNSKLINRGKMICEERDTGRVFYGSIQDIQKACTLAVTDNWPPFPEEMPIEIPINDIYDWLNLKRTEYGKKCFKLLEPHIEVEYKFETLDNGDPYLIYWFPQLSQD